MKRPGHNNATMFIGAEVEHTPANGRKTLFVVGKQQLDNIVTAATEHSVTHVFMGANHSFDYNAASTAYWKTTITALLDKGFWVTLDYPAHQHKDVLTMFTPGVWQSRLFVPLLSVRIPKIETSNLNLTVKIDDVDFAATNPGVWCMSVAEVTDSNRFTGWGEYSADSVVSTETEKIIAVPAVTPEPLLLTIEMNDPNIGIDPTPITALKEDNTFESIFTDAVADPAVTAEDAAKAYAAGSVPAAVKKQRASVKK